MNGIIASLPKPFINDSFELFKKGIYDNEDINVFINQQRDFAFLFPRPVVDYSYYTPRVKRLDLQEYKKERLVTETRLQKVSYLFDDNLNYLEIGAGDGAFAEAVKSKWPSTTVTLVEPDLNTKNLRKGIIDSICFNNLEELYKDDQSKKYDIICLFHVLEHILDPVDFLKKIVRLMHQDSYIVIEVPSLYDPLIHLYSCEEYKNFYFQSQHPFIYSDKSIQRLLEFVHIKKNKVISYQRYGLENHLNWLINKKPGGNTQFKDIFCVANNAYIEDLEQCGFTDTVIFIGKSDMIDIK